VQIGENGSYESASSPAEFEIEDGYPIVASDSDPRMAYFDIAVDRFFTDEDQTIPFSGTVFPSDSRADDNAGNAVMTLYGNAARNSSPLTTLGFERGLAPIGMSAVGRYLVLLCVFLFAISTAISWSYYGDRCANYLWGKKAILPYKMVFLIMHFVGAVLAVSTIWDIGDVALSLVTLPNVVSLILLSGLLKKLTDSYFERKPWEKFDRKKNEQSW
jgi:AGCS family alanine or glycine:cation symporter